MPTGNKSSFKQTLVSLSYITFTFSLNAHSALFCWKLERKARVLLQPPTPRAPPTDPNLAQCPICTRSFAKDRLDKHKVICEKSGKKKRKVFDPVKMRVQGTESESYLRKMKNKKPEVRLMLFICLRLQLLLFSNKQ